jgi:hypothetical protein
LRLGKLGAVTLIRVPTQRFLFGADQPPNFVGVPLPAIHAGEVGRLPSLALVKKVAFIHRKTILALFACEGQRHVGKMIWGEFGNSVGKDPTLGAATVGGHGVNVGLHLLLTKGLLNQFANGCRVTTRESQ